MGDVWEAVEPTFGYGCGDFQVTAGVILEAGHLCQACWAEIDRGEEVAVITDEVGDQAIYHQRCLPGKYGIERLTA